MKYDKLPILKISNAVECPVTVKKYRRIIKFFKIISVFLVSLFLVLLLFFVNLKLEQSSMIEQKMIQETSKTNTNREGVVLDATSNIIAREGGIPLDVAKNYALWIYDSAAKNKVDPILILSVMYVESKFNYRAISPSGPVGLLQIAYTYHKDKTTQAALFDPKNNIEVGTRIIGEYHQKSKTEIETLLRYNGSLNTETPVYALKVLKNKRQFEKEIMNAVAKSA